MEVGCFHLLLFLEHEDSKTNAKKEKSGDFGPHRRDAITFFIFRRCSNLTSRGVFQDALISISIEKSVLKVL